MPGTLKTALLAAALAAGTLGVGVAFTRRAPSDDARITSFSGPSSLAPGQRATVTLSVSNTGTADWAYPDVKLGAVGDNAGDASKFLAGAGGDPTRVWLAPGEVVHPGSVKAFRFDIVGPAAGTYHPDLQMVREGVHWFGAHAPTRVVVGAAVVAAPPPPPAPSPTPSGTVDAASLVSVAIPDTLAPGAASTFTVVVRNDGTSTWNDDFRLGVVDNLAGDGSRFLEAPSLGYPDVGRIHLAAGTSVTPGQTYTFTFNVVAPATPSHAYDVKLRMVHENVTWFGATAQKTVTTGAAPLVTFPTYEAMRRFRGDLSGIRIPEIKPYGANDVFFTAVYAAYPPSVRAIIRDVYKKRGYTHLPISVRLGDYHGLYPQYDFTKDPQGLRAILEEVWVNGLIPVLFVIDDQMPSQTAADMANIKATYTSLLQGVKDLVYLVCPGWEINAWMSPENMTESCKWLKQTLPDALVYIHFTAGHAAGSGPTQTEADWWKSMQGTLMGILYQHDGTQGGQAVSDRLADFTVRFQTGFHSWPTGFDVVAFEYSAYWQTNQGMSEQWGNDIGDMAMSKTTPPIQGYCDGGTLSVTATTLPPCPWLPAAVAPSPVGGSGQTPAPTPPPAGLPALVAPTIVSNASGTTISWGEAGRGSQGFTIDVDDDASWNTGFWNKVVAAGQTSTTSPDGFQAYGGASGPLVLTPGATYTVRVYYQATQEHGPDATFVAASGGVLGPKPAGKDELDLAQVTILNSPGDVPSWPATASLTLVDCQANGVHVDFSKKDGAGSWPDLPFGQPGDSLEYTLWIVIKVNGSWYGSGCIQYWRGLDRNGGPPSQYAANWYYDSGRWGPMVGHQPAVGEQVGFFVTAGNERNVGSTLVKERSNVILVPFPSDAGAAFTR